jgi:hypothetical protein
MVPYANVYERAIATISSGKVDLKPWRRFASPAASSHR